MLHNLQFGFVFLKWNSHIVHTHIHTATKIPDYWRVIVNKNKPEKQKTESQSPSAQAHANDYLLWLLIKPFFNKKYV